MTQINSNVNASKTLSSGLLIDFFHLKLPSNFYGTNVNYYDIRIVDGFRLFRMRQAYSNGFGDLY